MAWTTETEMKFIDGLGSYKPESPSLPRVKLLRKYYRAAKKRKDWGDIDYIAIRDRIRGELGWKESKKKSLTKNKK